MDYHPSLKLQIQNTLGLDSTALHEEPIAKLLTAVNASYIQSDADQASLEKLLKVTSQELNQRYQDIEKRLQEKSDSHQKLEQLLSIIHSTLEVSVDGILLVDESGDPVILNSRAAELLCATEDDIKTKTAYELIDHVYDKVCNPDALKQQLIDIDNDPTASTSGILERDDGVIVELNSQARVQNDRIVGRVWNLRDITQLQKSEEVIRHRAYHDVLTDLPNRSLFSDRIEHALSLYKRTGDRVALMFLDLDGFKYINDTLGHDVGDLVLQEVALRLKKVVREHDTIARHGGDEFLVMLEKTENLMQVEVIAKRILQYMTKKFVLEGQDVYISASIGVTLAPDDGNSAEQLIANADMAMYHAKAQGRNNYQFFKPSMAQKSSDRLSIKNQLHQALKNNEFLLHYQPKVALGSGRIIGAEALIRWQQNKDNLIMPNDFIPLAEKTGLIIPISEWVINTAFAQLQEWLPDIDAGFVLSVNLSAQHFKQSNLVSFIAEALERFNIPSHYVEIELTEYAIMDDYEKSIEKLQQLRDLGIHLSIDDFGTGYSSFNYLKSLPINIVKIDRSFIKDIPNSDKDLSLVESIVNIAHTLGLKVVAEGVETQKVNDLLRQLSCDMAQGYLYDKPMAASVFTQQLT